MDRLQLAFARFRRTHKPRAWYPQGLRAEVLAALRGGASEPAMRRACGLSAAQLAAWRRREVAPERGSALAMQPARVFSVVDEIPDASVAGAIQPVGEDLELRIGGWTVRIRRVDG